MIRGLISASVIAMVAAAHATLILPGVSASEMNIEEPFTSPFMKMIPNDWGLRGASPSSAVFTSNISAKDDVPRSLVLRKEYVQTGPHLEKLIEDLFLSRPGCQDSTITKRFQSGESSVFIKEFDSPDSADEFYNGMTSIGIYRATPGGFSVTVESMEYTYPVMYHQLLEREIEILLTSA